MLIPLNVHTQHYMLFSDAEKSFLRDEKKLKSYRKTKLFSRNF